MNSSHTYKSKKYFRLLFAATLSAFSLSGFAQLSPNHFGSTSVSSSGPGGQDADSSYLDIVTGVGSHAFSNSPFIWNGSSTVQHAVFNGTASADIPTGSLRTYASVQNFIPYSGPALPLGQRNQGTYSEASFGDTFTIRQHDPGALAPAGTGQLILTLHGSFSVTGNVDLSSVFSQNSFINAYNFYTAGAYLQTAAIGGLALQKQIAELDENDFATYDDFNAEFTRLNLASLAGRRTYGSVYVGSNQQVLSSLIAHGSVFSSTYIVSPNYEILQRLSINFAIPTAGTNFEWLASIYSNVMLDSSTLSASIVADFGNTAELSVILPEGYDLVSQSGAFPQSRVSVALTAVPEPSTYGLCAVSLLIGVCAWRRRYTRGN